MFIDMKIGITLRVQILPDLCSLCNYNVFVSPPNQLWIKNQDVFGNRALVRSHS